MFKVILIAICFAYSFGANHAIQQCKEWKHKKASDSEWTNSDETNYYTHTLSVHSDKIILDNTPYLPNIVNGGKVYTSLNRLLTIMTQEKDFNTYLLIREEDSLILKCSTNTTVRVSKLRPSKLVSNSSIKSIKGFSLDMSFEDACMRLKNIGYGKSKYTEMTSNGITLCGYDLILISINKSGPYIARENNIIQEIYFAADTIDKLFKSSILSVQEFAEKFFSSYGMSNVQWEKRSFTKGVHYFDAYTYTFKDTKNKIAVWFFGMEGDAREQFLYIKRLDEVPDFN